MKLLIAYDGSDIETELLGDLRRAGIAGDAEAIILTAADVVLPPLPLEEYEKAETESDKHARAGARELSRKAKEAVGRAQATADEAALLVQQNFPSWSVRAEGVGDSPAWAIVKKAEEWNADLVVVGSRGRSAVGRFFLGSVSQTVVKEAPCSVRIARDRQRDAEAPLRILIGIDGSTDSSAALGAIASRDWPEGTEARVMAVLDLMMTTAVDWISEGDESEEDWIRRAVDASAEKLRAKGLEVSSKVESGDPKRCLISEAEEWRADAIFVGARGLRGIERFFLGSVSTAVAIGAPCSVEVVRQKQSP